MDANFNNNLIYKNEVYKIIGAALEVVNHLGCGFLEAVYQEALAIELERCSVPFEAQKRIPIFYKDRLLAKEYVADFLCYEKIIVEIKAIKMLTDIEKAQIVNYLKAAKLPLGLIINFGSKKMEWKRFVNTR